ncbi:MAG: BamA/TamA family outer membrane protein [Cyanothece sp. SIO2G6]|nr:BamA/TamA family outer membrane protein [Cyanothece sp. SIO2G6]
MNLLINQQGELCGEVGMNVGHQPMKKQWRFTAIAVTVSGMVGFGGGTISQSWAIEPESNSIPTSDQWIANLNRETETGDRFVGQTTTIERWNGAEADVIDPLLPFANPAPLVAQNRISEFGSDRIEVDVPPGNGERITDIEVRFVDDGNPDGGHTRDFVIRREFDLEPGDRYDPALAAAGLRRLNNLDIVREASVSLEPTESEGDAVMVITVDERRLFTVRFGLSVPHPTSLHGPNEPDTVLPGTERSGGLSGGLQLQLTNLFGINQTFAGGIEAGEHVGSFAISYTNPQVSRTSPIGFAANVFNSREVQTVFNGGDTEVELPNDRDPWVHRFGGGLELFGPLSPNLAIASGFSFQSVTIRDDVFTDDTFLQDELGNDLTFSGGDEDELLTWTVATAWDRRDDPQYPTRGHRFLFRTDQYIPIGEANVFGNRLSANYTQYVPFSLFGFDDGPRTLVLNVQGGTFIGDLPPYEAFSLGGSGSVRGFDNGDVGTGRSFIQATAEYRFPIFDFVAFREEIDIGGTLFVDYANDLGSGDTVLGEPAEVRDKPGDGLGYGVGIRARTPVGPVRVEFGIADTGDTNVIFKIGDRF